MTSPSPEERATWRQLYGSDNGYGSVALMRTIDALDTQDERVRQLEAALRRIIIEVSGNGSSGNAEAGCIAVEAIAEAAIANTQPVAEPSE